MANVKKKTPIQQKKEIIEEITEKNDDIVDDDVVEIKRGNSRSKNFDDHDYILCHSVTTGGLGIIGGKTETYYRFNEYGAECDIEYVDLVQLVRSRSKYIFTPHIIIDDKDFLAEFPQVVEAYNNMYSRGDLKKILQLPADQMRVEIEKLPDGAKDTLRTMAATAIANGTMDSIASARVLSDIFGADFNFLSELFKD